MLESLFNFVGIVFHPVRAYGDYLDGRIRRIELEERERAYRNSRGYFEVCQKSALCNSTPNLAMARDSYCSES